MHDELANCIYLLVTKYQQEINITNPKKSVKKFDDFTKAFDFLNNSFLHY